ncbi:GNAT family N-acetyltransferase [Amnibacterium endophyticum]|uniref:GNAT family N-acetyltransferase n=1 Tax=Amnibacterium endophyticum TaxID=2109337 RepID=A0ABW4LGG9_9MICO
MDDLLAAYDDQLRGDAEVRSALRTMRLGPALLAVFPDGFGFITCRDLPPGDPAPFVRDALDRLRADADVRVVEWKTRAHDRAPGLLEALAAAGFEEGEAESIMIGEARLLARDVPLPEGVRLRRMTSPDDVRAASAMADQVFGDPVSEDRAEDLLRRIARGGELWAAESGGEVVSTGRLEPVPGTAFAGLWGGATRADHRHRGIYRALTAARARSALDRGIRYLSSDSTEFSRPILERSGFRRVSSTTPWEWRR